MLFDSKITFSDSASLRRMVGMASARRPCSVRTHQARAAPATRKREVSESPERFFSSEIAQLWSSVAQWQDSPLSEQTPWPYCVIFKAVQRYSGKAAIKPATTLVLPTLRECPPITTIAMGLIPLPSAAPAGCRRDAALLLLRHARQGCQFFQVF